LDQAPLHPNRSPSARYRCAVRILVIVNPRATTTTPHEREVLANALAGAAAVEIVQTTNRGHAAALACRAMRDGTDAVVAFGGDGTINEVVNGLLTDGQHDRVPMLGVIPGGATNVFARALGLPNDPVESTGLLLDAIRSGHRRSVGLGRADERWFIFAAGIGFDAAIIARVDRMRNRGRRSSELLFARAGLREFFAADRRHPRLRVELADGSTIDRLHYVVVTNTDPWTYIGNRALHPTPEASFETGLDIFARTRMGAVGVLWTVGHIARQSPGPAKLGSLVRHDLDEFTIRAEVAMPLQVDGELIGDRTAVRFRAAPDALNVLVSA
jgi:diacylglycerol kinase family enzyme